MRSTRTRWIVSLMTATACCLSLSIARAEIDEDTIVGMWLFDEGKGAAAADATGGHEGKLTKAPEWVAGKYGTALDFNGGNYVELLDSAPTLHFGAAAPFSITAWVKPTTGGTVIGKFNGGVVGAYILTANGTGTINFHREVAPWGLAAAGQFDNGEFNHVAATYDGAEMKVYVNGKEIATQPRGPQNTDTATPVFIGARMTGGNPSEFYSGTIDEVGLFNVALSENQVEEVMLGLGGPSAVEPTGKLSSTWGRLKTPR
ncbi:MAG: LamG domain-containing protein [Candidatus Poribacteria bacterium]|nr:LamG domain-containing protein [Candidatus Poribacteria bacterium]